MDRSLHADTKLAGGKEFFQVGLRGVLALIASCALITWAWLRLSDSLESNESLRLIRAGTVSQRRTAAGNLRSETGDQEVQRAFSALVDALRDDDAEVRGMAAQSLAVLVNQLQGRPAITPSEALLLKTRIDTTVQGLVKLLADPDVAVRVAASQGLGSMVRSGRSSPTAEQLEAMTDESNAVRRAAALEAWGSRDVPIPPELAAMLADPSAAVRTAAARALARFPTALDETIPTLLLMIENDEPAVRRSCMTALDATWPAPPLVPTLVAALGSREREVRSQAATLLGRIGPEARAARPALIALLKEPLPAQASGRTDAPIPPRDLAVAAARALGQMGQSQEVLSALVRMLSGKFDERLFAAAGAIGALGPPAEAAVPALIDAYKRLLDSHRSVIGQMAVPEALGRVAPGSSRAPDAVAILMRALDSSDRWIRRGAVRALGQFGKAAAPAIPRLQALRDDPDSGLREDVAAALAAIEGRSQPKVAALPSPASGPRPVSAAD
jgi:HEAT repeat protein